MKLQDEKETGGLSQARDVRVWDPLVRMIHWGVVLAILLNWVVLDEEGVLHQWIGYMALGLVIVRLLWGVIGSRHARFSAFPPNFPSAWQYAKRLKKPDRIVHLSHNPLGGLMAYNMWATILFISLTGYLMGTSRFFGIGWMKDLHEVAFNWLVLSLLLHLGGVLFDSKRSGVSLVRAMVTGIKHIPKGKSVK